jgi:nucleoid-associated protein YgaU
MSTIGYAAFSSDLQAALGKILAVEEQISAMLTSASTADLRGWQSALTLAIADAWALRRELDGEDQVDHLTHVDGAALSALWLWERELRRRVQAVLRDAQDLLSIIGDLLDGVQVVRHRVRDGDTLQSIATRYLGSWQEWPRIASANGLEPGQPAAGTLLTIPTRTGR